MNTQEIKEQAHKEFRQIGEGSVRFIANRQDCYDFIDSIIDKTVQMTEEGVVRNIIENLQKHIEESEIALKESEGEDCEITKDYKLAIKNVVVMVKSLITNKSDGIKQECDNSCGYVQPYGFVPEADCPVHDTPLNKSDINK